MNKWHIFSLVAALLLGSDSALGQEALSLSTAVSMALEKNQTLRGAEQELESARWGKIHAVSNFLPKVDIDASVTRIDAQSESRANAAIDFIKGSAGMIGIPPSALDEIKPFAYLNTFFAGVTVIQPIYNGGAEFVWLSAANAQHDKSEFALEDTEQDVVTRVKTAYFNVLKLEEMVTLAKEAVERSKRHLELTQKRQDMGMRTRTDVLRWEVQRASDEGIVVNVENLLAAARLQLNEVLGVELNREFALEKVVFDDTLHPVAEYPLMSPPLASLTGFGMQPGVDPATIDAHPSMQMMRANLRLADLNVAGAWVNFKPRVNLAFLYGWERNNTIDLDGIRPWSLTLSVKFPIFNGFGDYSNLQKAHAEYQRAEAQVESFHRGLQMQATVAQLAVRSTAKRIEITRKSQQEAQDVLNAVTRRYETGGASNVDLIDVQTAYTTARKNYIAALYDHEIAKVQYARATGAVQK